MGLTRTDGGIHVSAVAAAKACSLLLFVKEDKNGKEARFREVRNIPFPEEGKTGHVWSMTLNGAFDDLYYAFETGRGTGRFIFHMRIVLCTGLMCGG